MRQVKAFTRAITRQYCLNGSYNNENLSVLTAKFPGDHMQDSTITNKHIRPSHYPDHQTKVGSKLFQSDLHYVTLLRRKSESK